MIDSRVKQFMGNNSKMQNLKQKSREKEDDYRGRE